MGGTSGHVKRAKTGSKEPYQRKQNLKKSFVYNEDSSNNTMNNVIICIWDDRKDNQYQIYMVIGEGFYMQYSV